MINDFSSYFEIFAGLNVAYAGSERFRTAVDNDIFSLEKLIKHKQSQFIVSRSESPKFVISKLSFLQKKYEEELERITLEE